MALTIYEGIKDNQQVDENIDEEILRLLGLEDVSDLDYDEYKTLLKERMAAGRMPGNDVPTEDTERLTEEFKRVKKETGRFKVKNNKIKFNSVVKATEKTKPVSTPTKTLMGSDAEPQEKETEVGSEPQDMMGFLTAVVAPSLSKIETSLFNILSNLSSQQQAEDKASEKGRVAGQKAKKRDKEEKQESGKGLLDGLGNIGKKVLSPLSDLFSSIFKFLYNIVLGMLALGVLQFLKDPGKIFRDINNSIIDFFNGFIKSIFDIIFFPYNAFINLINGSINEFEFAINSTIGKIPGIPDLKLPDIPNIEAPQIPRIEPPPEKTEKPKNPAAKVPIPATAMTGGGEVTNVTNNNTTNNNDNSRATNKYYQLMEGGGKVRTDSGEKVTGAGPDTQLVALQPGETVMQVGAREKQIESTGIDPLSFNVGPNANKPKMAKVQSASGGGMIPAMSGGGVVLNPPTMDAYLKASAAASNEGIDLGSQTTSTFRSAAKQQELIDRWKAGDPNVFTPAAVGKSPHQQGWSIDMNAGSAANLWMRKNGGNYGFRWQGNRDPVHFDFVNDQPNDYWLQEGRTGWQKSGGQTVVSPQQTATGEQKTTSSRKSKDYWALAAIMSVEAGNPQGRADVATSIMNRAASGGVYKGSPSIHALVNAKDQYQPVRIGNPKLWAEIEDKKSAIRALNSVPYVRGQGASFISEATAVLSDQGLMNEAAKFVGPRTDFSTPKTMNGPNKSHADFRATHRDKEVSRHNHIFGFFVGPGAVTLGTKRFGEGAGATSMESMNISSGNSSGQQLRQSSQSPSTSSQSPSSQVDTSIALNSYEFSSIDKKAGTPGSNNQSLGPSTSDLVVPSMTPGSYSLPIVSPKVKPSSRSNIQPPKSRTGSGGIVPIPIPGQKQPTSSSGGNQTDAPMFPSTDQNNPELLVIKSIYNIV